MNISEKIKSVKDLLEIVRLKPHPVLINICPACSSSTFLMEKVVTRVVSEHQTHIEYIKINHSDAYLIKEDLKLTKSPVFLLVVRGEIIEVLSGTIGYQQLNRAAAKVINNDNLHNNSIAI